MMPALTNDFNFIRAFRGVIPKIFAASLVLTLSFFCKWPVNSFSQGSKRDPVAWWHTMLL